MKALIVEDDHLNLKYITHILKKNEISHDVVRTGADAMEKLTTARYDVVLMDIKLPDIYGDEVIAGVRESANRNRATPIIAVTAYALSGDRERFIAAGATDYLSKPFEAGDLMRAVCGNLLAIVAPGPARNALCAKLLKGDYQSFLKIYESKKTKGEIDMDKIDVTREEHVSSEQLAKFFDDLAMGFRSGSVTMKQGMEAITLTPPGVVFFEASMSQKKRKEKIEIEISWKRLEAPAEGIVE
ncbi:MAG: response regulator [Desulfovibrionaceae bacterium]|nr:response regulator [Desulfovibrionaceae bacterium]MBF0514885.1 response regulator [Desulfovibrionaceae bacterium]